MSSLSRLIPLFAIALISVSVLSIVVGEERVENDREPNLFGKVFDSVNEKGIMAVIHFGGGPENSYRYTVESSAEGAFRLYLPPGEYVFEAEARGYMETRGEFKIIEGEKTELQIKMDALDAVKEDNLHGMVVDARTGEGIIAVVGFGGIETDIALRAETDRSGAFSLLIRPGGYHYHVIAEGYEPVRDEIRIGEEPQRIRIEMKRVQEEERDFGVVKGFVGTPEGKPVPGAAVMFMPLIREDVNIREDGTVVEEDVRPERMEPITTRTDEKGYFVVRLRFGGYEIHAEARGYHPAGMPFRIGPDNPGAEVKIVMERMEKEEPGFGGLGAEFKMIDDDSDGIPELIHVALDVNGDGEIDAEYHYEDENSDGNPEIVTWMLDLPPESVERVMNIIFKLISMRNSMPPMDPEYGMWEKEEYYDEEGCCPGYDDGEGYPPEEMGGLGIVDLIEEWMDEGREEEFEDQDDEGSDPDDVGETDDPDASGEIEDSKSTADKKSGGAPVVEIVTAIGMAVLVAAVIVIAGYFLIKRRS